MVRRMQIVSWATRAGTAIANAAAVLFSAAGTGAVSRSVQDKLREAPSITDYGAVGDGVTDCGPAFLAVSGKMATLPEGHFAVYGDVPMSLNTKLLGAGPNLTFLHVYGEMSWNSSGNFQSGYMAGLTVVYHGTNKARIFGINMVFASFTQNMFKAENFHLVPASTADRALVAFDVKNPRQAIFESFYADMNFSSTTDPTTQVKETFIKTSGTGFGLMVANYFVRDVYYFVHQTETVEGGHIGKGEVVGCYDGVFSDAIVPGGWIVDAHINAVHRAVNISGRTAFWVEGLSAFRSPVFYPMDWAPIELTNCGVANVDNVQAFCNPSGHTSRSSGIIATNVNGLTVTDFQAVELGQNGGSLFELTATVGFEISVVVAAACSSAASIDATCSNGRIDYNVRSGAGAVSNASTTVYIRNVNPERQIAPQGTATAPGITFADELDCGLYVPAANQVGITVAGNEAHRFIAAGTANRIESVSAAAAAAPRLRAQGTDTNIDLQLEAKGTGAVQLYAGGSARVTVPSTGGLTVAGLQMCTAQGHLRLRQYTVATLPNVAVVAQMIYVSDGTGNKRIAVSDGVNWRWPDGAIVS